jgi:hypothetical protein
MMAPPRGTRLPIAAAGRLVGRMLERRRRVAHGRQTLEQVLARLPDNAPPGGWQVDGGRAASGTRVVFRIVGGDRPALIAKIGYADADRRGLRTGAGVLGALGADPRLAGWRVVVPSLVASGELGDATYVVETAMPGTTPTPRDAESRRRLADEAADLVGGLHRATAEPVADTGALVEDWVRAPLRAIVAACGDAAVSGAAREHAARIEADLDAALARGPVTSSLVHGDFWPGNLLEADGRLTAILDWDSSIRSTASVDLVHLLLHLRRGTESRSIGETAAEVLSVRRWDGHETAILGRGERNALDDRSAILLWWVRFVAGNLERHPDAAATPRWLARNVSVVLDAAGASA